LRKKLLHILLVGCLCLAGLSLAAGVALAQTEQPTPSITAQSGSALPGVANDTCLACHGQPDQYTTLPSGEQLYTTVDPQIFEASVHGQAGIACVQCHPTIRSYPHPALVADNARDLTITMNQVCETCHAWAMEKIEGSVHQLALEAGNKNAPVCTDCHGAHNAHVPNDPPSETAKTCDRCHSEIYNQYHDSVHGSALIGEGNTDVPSCIDCHGVHDVQGPDYNTDFKLRSPLICAKCHADEELMAKYGISTQVFDTYLSDFHGTTVMFEVTAEGQETNKPVCIDCHGVHDILPPEDAQSTVMQDNLLTTCQRCHPDASTNFPTAWLGHYTPDRTKYPITYFVNLFYLIIIPAVLGIMVLFVGLDILRRFILRPKESKHG
jgi:hypothetical protein